jgi:hypothetical protein
MQDCDLGHVSLNETTFQYNNGHHRVRQIRVRLVTTCWPHSQDRGPAGPPVVQPIQFGSVVNLGPKYRRRGRRADMVIEQ